jgi:hypothetical protein
MGGYMPKNIIILKKCILIVLVSLNLQSNCYAKTPKFNDKNCIKAAMGEARGEGYKGLLAICCAIRNRGSLKGVYGTKAKFKEPKWVWKLAKKAWKESKAKRIHSGDHWGSIHCDKAWLKQMRAKGFTRVYSYRGHIFYKHP